MCTNQSDCSSKASIISINTTVINDEIDFLKNYTQKQNLMLLEYIKIMISNKFK